MVVMTSDQRKRWAEAVIKHEPPTGLYEGLSVQEASMRASALCTAAAQTGCWTHLPNHLVLLQAEIMRRSR